MIPVALHLIDVLRDEARFLPVPRFKRLLTTAKQGSLWLFLRRNAVVEVETEKGVGVQIV